jgi:hypothetical protein
MQTTPVSANHYKGWYATEAALNAAWPTANDGDWAIVGDTDTVWVWDGDTSAWKDSGLGSLVTSVFGRTGAVVAQAGDYTAAQVGALEAASNLNDVASKPASRNNLGVPQIHTSTSDPTVDNDGVDTAGLGKTFAKGDLWLNTSTGILYRCIDNATGAALWCDLDSATCETLYGNGEDGDVTISGSVTLTANANYRSLTLAAGASLNGAGYFVRVRDLLDLSAAQAGAINHNGNSGGNGGATGTAGAQPGAQGANEIPGGVTRGLAGGAGGQSTNAWTGQQATQNGTQTIATSSSTPGSGMTSGAGGAGASGAGGAAQVPGTVNTTVYKRPIMYTFLRGATAVVGGVGGDGGGGGGGDSVTPANGGGGGAGGNSGRPVVIFARIINRGGNTNTGIITAKGGNGGNGGTPTTGNAGGGGGGSGGGGGWVYICYQEIRGSTITGAIDVTGGNGGNGGSGSGTGSSGGGGSSGHSGTVMLINVRARTSTVSTIAAAVAASGQTGGAATTKQIDL